MRERAGEILLTATFVDGGKGSKVPPYLNRGSRAPPDLNVIHLQSSIIVLQEIQL